MELVPHGMRSLLLLSLVGFVAVLSTSTDDTAPDPATHCPSILRSRPYSLRTFASKCYEFVNVEKRWFQAWHDCSGNGGRMVSIKNYATQQFLTNTMNSLGWNRNGVWNGLQDWADETKWQWSTEDGKIHEALMWAFWAPGHPEQGFGAIFAAARDCVSMKRVQDYRWHETLCDNQFYQYQYICQYEIVWPTTTTESTIVSTTPSATNASTTAAATTTSTTTEAPTTPQQSTWIVQPPPDGGTLIKGSTTTTLPTTTTQEDPAIMAARQATDSLAGGSLAGIIVACLLILLLIIIVLIALLVRRRRKAKASNEENGPFDNPVYGSPPIGITSSSDSNTTTPATSPAHEGRVLLSASARRAQFEKPRIVYGVNLHDPELDPDMLKKGASGLTVRLDDDDYDDDDDLKKPSYLHREEDGARAMNVYETAPTRGLPPYPGKMMPNDMSDEDDDDLKKPSYLYKKCDDLDEDSHLYDNSHQGIVPEDGAKSMNLYIDMSQKSVENIYQNPADIDGSTGALYADPPKAPPRKLNSEKPPLALKPKLLDVDVDRNPKKMAVREVYDSPRIQNPYDEIPAEQYIPEDNMYESLDNLYNSLEEKRAAVEEGGKDDVTC